MLLPLGYELDLSSKEGGGSKTVIDHLNCERCEAQVELWEWDEPNKKQRKKGIYFPTYYWCPECKLYKNSGEQKFISKLEN